jgi:hypothetical protein
MKSSAALLLATGLIVAGLAAFGGEPSEQTIQGECLPVFGTDVCTWAKTVGDRVVEVGATVPVSSIEKAPAEAEMVWPPHAVARVEFPAEVKKQTGIDHLGVNWEAHGHPPGPYLTPHFDFHFNMETPSQIEAIDCSDLSEPASLPAGYELPDVDIPDMGTLVGLCVPEMGMHAARKTELEATNPFGASMIVGYYAKKPIFVEPMIARKKLMERKSFSLDVPKVSTGGKARPTGFKADYDAASDAYRISFSFASNG